MAIIGAISYFIHVGGSRGVGHRFKISIPLMPFLAIFISFPSTYWRKNWYILTIFLIYFLIPQLLIRLVRLQPSLCPPQVEVLALEKISGSYPKDIHIRGMGILNLGAIQSLCFSNLAKKISSSEEYMNFGEPDNSCGLSGWLTLYGSRKG